MTTRKRSLLSTPVVYPFALRFSDVENARMSREWRKRVLALYDHYGIKTLEQNAFRSRALLHLVLVMGAERFPNGFTPVLRGNHDKTKPTQWTADRHVELIAHFRKCKREGLTQMEAAKRFRKAYPRLGSNKGVISRYKKAEAWWRRKPRTDQEACEVAYALGTNPTFASTLSLALNKADDTSA